VGSHALPRQYISIFLKAKKKEAIQEGGIAPVPSGSGTVHTGSSSTATNVPTWTNTQWKRVTDIAEPSLPPRTSPEADSSPSVPLLKEEDAAEQQVVESSLEASAPSSVKTEFEPLLNTPPASEMPSNAEPGLFKKRKARGATGGGKRDKF